MSEGDDQGLFQQVDQLTNQELRGVIKYLVLLNAEAVQNALNYTFQQRQTATRTTTTTATSVDNSFDDKFLSEFDTSKVVEEEEEEEEPTTIYNFAPRAPPRSQPVDASGLDEDDNDILKPPASALASPSSITPHKPTSSFDANSTDSAATPQISNSSSSGGGGIISNTTQNIQLIMLCTMKPSTNQQAIDQDDAMVFCKHIGVPMPYVVLAENKPEKTRELQSISKLDNAYPQFFVSSTSDNNNNSRRMEYLGSLDTLRQYKKVGTVTCEQDLHKFLKPTKTPEETMPKDEDEDAKRQLIFPETKKQTASYSGIPEHLQSRADYQQPQTSDLYEHLLKLAESNDSSSSPLKKKPDSDDTEGDDKLSETNIGPLEPPEFGRHAVLQDKNGNRQAEPPARSPPTSAKKPVRARDGTENEFVVGVPELSTTEPSSSTTTIPTQQSTVPATPNRKAEAVNIAEPPAMSPPRTTTKVQRRTNLEEHEGLVVSTPNAQVIKRYHNAQNNSKPEPTPGGVQELRMEAIPLEPPSAHKREENPSAGQYVPESPPVTMVVPEVGQQQDGTTPSVTPEIPGYQEQPSSAATTKEEQQAAAAAQAQIQSPPSPADDEILDILNGVGACYLIYEEQQDGGTLNIYYSESPMDRAVGVWSSNDITEFKQAQGLGTKEFIGNCATACQQNPASYFKGWSQFIKAAKSMNGTVITLTKFGMPVEFYTYSNNGGDAICEKVPGIQFEMAGVDAVACMPKGTNFDYQSLRGRKWSKQAKKLGSVATFNSLVHNTGVSAASGGGAALPPKASPSNAASGIPTSLDLPANPTDEMTTTASKSMMMEDVSSIPVREPKEGYPSAMEAPCPEGGACYLVYEPDSSGRLLEQFSKTPVEGAIGMWVPGPGKKIAGFKFKNNQGKSVLIGNCSAGVQGRKNYCSGWNQFVRSARIQKGDVMLWDPVEGVKGLPVDVWLYTNDKRPGHQSHMLERGVSVSVESVLAVSTIPKNTSFFEGISVDILKWLAHGSTSGASSKFE